jgi:hypothetical protein
MFFYFLFKSGRRKSTQNFSYTHYTLNNRRPIKLPKGNRQTLSIRLLFSPKIKTKEKYKNRKTDKVPVEVRLDIFSQAGKLIKSVACPSKTP